MVGGFTGRDNFGPFLHSLGLGVGAIGVEVGTHRGEFAARLLTGWSGFLYCLDPWLPYPPIPGDRTQDREATRRVLVPYVKRTALIDQTSVEGAKPFRVGGLSFVYVDARHEYESTLEDLRTWWPKVEPGGVLAGHDIICTGEVGGGWGAPVQAAILAFGTEIGLPVHLVPEVDGRPWSYYFLKPLL